MYTGADRAVQRFKEKSSDTAIQLYTLSHPGRIIRWSRSFSAAVFLVILLFVCPSTLRSQEVPAATEPAVPIPAEPVPETVQEKKQERDVNIDSRLAYGMYNTILASFNLAQDHEFFTYQLNSDLRRSNDFGYKNSSYYEGDVGFTGKADLTDSWNLIPEIQVKNESHGMYDNTVYSREEKDRIIVNLRNEYKPGSSRWDFNVGTAHYVHRLNEVATSDVTSSSFYKLYEEIDWEYIWSASNRFGFRHGFSAYNYSRTGAKCDYHIDNEIFVGFKVTEYVKLEGGIICDWDRNLESLGGVFPSGRVNASLVGFRSASLELEYAYDLLGFRPEEFYFEKKYIYPEYNLPPERIHRLQTKAEYNFTFAGEGDTRLRRIRLKGNGILEKNRDFYNYVPETTGNVLGAETLDVFSLGGRGDMLFETLIFKWGLDFDFFYEYRYYSADEKVTYHPSHAGGALLRIAGEKWALEWENRLLGKVYVDPATKDTLDKAVVGMLNIQYRLLESFYLYGRVDNLYNSDFSLRDHYPEPGRIMMGGLRIIF